MILKKHGTWWRKRPINRKHINIVLTALAGQSSQARTSPLSQGQYGDFTVELSRKRLDCPRDGSRFVPGTGPVCPRQGSCREHRPAQNVSDYWFFLPDLQESRGHPGLKPQKYLKEGSLGGLTHFESRGYPTSESQTTAQQKSDNGT